MYAGVDIGGTKTLIAALDDSGVIVEQHRFKTPQTYDEFLYLFQDTAMQLVHHDFKAGGIGAPGKIDRENGCGIWFGNLRWHNVPIDHDIERILRCPMIVENDAKMAALSEAMLVRDKYGRVLYVTVSTGIGYGLVVNLEIDSNIGDTGGKALLVEHHGKLVPWESFASGKALYEKYGKKASEIHDDATWRQVVRNLKPGLIELIAVTQPDVVIFGGGVGTYFNRWGDLLEHELNRYKTPLVHLPKLMGAQRPEEAVLYGCYDLARVTFPVADHTAAKRQSAEKELAAVGPKVRKARR